MSITTSGAATSPSIHAADYNRVNTGTHPITASMIFPNDTAWKDPEVECLIITNQSFVPALQPLANLKTGRGVYTIIVTVQSIYSDMRFTSSGPDRAAWIRNAIKRYHDANGTDFVILGGDVGIIPIRYTYNPDNIPSEPEYFSQSPVDYKYSYKPTDHYYAGLDGTWDNDGDGKFGEMGIIGTSADEVDWTADVYVGRLPVSTSTQAVAMVQKLIDYETSPLPGSWFDDAVFAGAVSQYAGDMKRPVDEAELSELMIDSYFAAMDPTRLYACTPSYEPPSSSPYTALSALALRDAWNCGAAVVNLAGHGLPTSFFGAGTSSYIDQAGAKALNNSGKLPFTYIFSCSSGAFDYAELNGGVINCLSEELLLNTNGGAIGVVSALRLTYFTDNDPLFEALNEGQNRFFWREFMANNEYRPGRALYLSQQHYIEQFINKYWNVDLNYDPSLASNPDYSPHHERFRKNLLTYNLLGDPELPIYTRTPRAFASGVFGQNASIGDELVLEIADEAGMPVSHARVLINGSGYYVVAEANAVGIASVRIPHDRALVGGSLTATLSGHNINMSRSSILVIEDTQAPTSLQVEAPSSDVDYRGELAINASGVDAGSGLRHAFIVLVDEARNPTAVYPMTRSRVEGNSTSFRFKYPGALPPGGKIQFYAIAFDASGNYVIATPAEDQVYTVTIASRLVEDVMSVVATIAAPAVAVAIISWFMISRRRRKLYRSDAIV